MYISRNKDNYNTLFLLVQKLFFLSSANRFYTACIMKTPWETIPDIDAKVMFVYARDVIFITNNMTAPKWRIKQGLYQTMEGNS